MIPGRLNTILVFKTISKNQPLGFSRLSGGGSVKPSDFQKYTVLCKHRAAITAVLRFLSILTILDS